jgi:hypothetical protein
MSRVLGQVEGRARAAIPPFGPALQSGLALGDDREFGHRKQAVQHHEEQDDDDGDD